MYFRDRKKKNYDNKMDAKVNSKETKLEKNLQIIFNKTYDILFKE